MACEITSNILPTAGDAWSGGLAVVDEATSPSRAANPRGLVASSTTLFYEKQYLLFFIKKTLHFCGPRLSSVQYFSKLFLEWLKMLLK
jgi:hypothetical protein